MRPKGSAAELETRRRLAGRLLLEGRKIGEVAEIVAACESSVRRWRRDVEKGGLEALKAKPHLGRKPRLNEKQKQRLVNTLVAGPCKAGYRSISTFLVKNADTSQFVELFRQLHHHYRRKVIVVWDRLGAHRSAAAHFEAEHPDWFEFEWLPAYAPELNPVEECWNHTKYADLPNFVPDDLDHLQTAVHESMLEQRDDQALLRSFFAYAKLPL